MLLGKGTIRISQDGGVLLPKPYGYDDVDADARRLGTKSRGVHARSSTTAVKPVVHPCQKEKGSVEAIATEPVFSLTHKG